MLTIETHGEFYFKSENLKGRKPFEQTIKAASLDFFKQTAIKYTGTDDEGRLKFKETDFINVRGIIKKRLLPLLLAPKHPEFVRVRSVNIDEIITDDGKTMDLPVTLQSRNQLIELCKVKKIPVSAMSYLDIDELRTDILEYQTDPEIFLKNMERKTKKRNEEKEFMVLNDLLPGGEPEALKTKTKIKPVETKTVTHTVPGPEPAGIEDL